MFYEYGVQIMTPDARVAAVEELRREWVLISGHPEERLRRTVRVLDGPAR
jgi:hypothetical protein